MPKDELKDAPNIATGVMTKISSSVNGMKNHHRLTEAITGKIHEIPVITFKDEKKLSRRLSLLSP